MLLLLSVFVFAITPNSYADKHVCILQPSTPARPRLKRRAGTNQPTSQFPKVEEDIHTSPTQEPPLKKFKALFEQSDPDKIAQSGVEEYRHTQFQGTEQSQTQNESSAETQVRAAKAVRLAVVTEEEEESASRSAATVSQRTSTQTLKRKTRSQDEDGDVEMVSAESGMPKTKKRAVEDVNAVASAKPESSAKPTSTSASKTASKSASKPASFTQSTKDSTQSHGSGEPDKDEAFLKAVATKKRGKNVDDTFDREFNNLRISKPEVEVDNQRKEWSVLEEFGDDGDLRGNFMVIVEIDVKTGGERTMRGGESRLDWEGKPDFKKFKKVRTISFG